jgi:hypothetical protein
LIGDFNKLQHLPAGLHKLSNLKRLEVFLCPAARSLPKDALPKSLEVRDVHKCDNEELKQQCRGLVGTIPRMILKFRDCPKVTTTNSLPVPSLTRSHNYH